MTWVAYCLLVLDRRQHTWWAGRIKTWVAFELLLVWSYYGLKNTEFRYSESESISENNKWFEWLDQRLYEKNEMEDNTTNMI